MSDVDYDDDDFDIDDLDDDDPEPDPAPKKSQAPKALRQHAAKVAKELKEAREELATLRAEKRKGNLADLLNKAGAKPAIARFVDIEGDITEESVKSWLEENGELFGYTAGEAEPDPDDVDDDVVDQQQSISRASASALPPPSGLTPEKLKRMTNAQLVEAGYLDPK